MTLTARAATRARGFAAERETRTMTVEYNTHPEDATPNRMLIERQLGWIVQTLHNDRIRKSERKCLLLLGGQILLAFLGQARRVGVRPSNRPNDSRRVS